MTWPMCSLLLPQLKAMSPGRGLQIVGGCILGQRSHLLLAEGPPVCSTIIHHHNSRRLWVPLPLNKPELYIQETVLLLSASVLSMANVFLRRDTIFFLIPQPEIEPGFLALRTWVLTTGPPGNSSEKCIFKLNHLSLLIFVAGCFVGRYSVLYWWK